MVGTGHEFPLYHAHHPTVSAHPKLAAAVFERAADPLVRQPLRDAVRDDRVALPTVESSVGTSPNPAEVVRAHKFQGIRRRAILDIESADGSFLVHPAQAPWRGDAEIAFAILAQARDGVSRQAVLLGEVAEFAIPVSRQPALAPDPQRPVSAFQQTPDLVAQQTVSLRESRELPLLQPR